MRRPTFTERKPPPTGVVIGPLSATFVSRIASSVSSGSGLPPNWSMTSAPACWTSHSNSTPVASRTRRVASVSSGPVPSPGMSVTGVPRLRTLAAHASDIVAAYGQEVGAAVRRLRRRDRPSRPSMPSRASSCTAGYDIADLAEHATYEEVAYLLLEGESRPRSSSTRSGPSSPTASCRRPSATLIDGERPRCVADGDAAHGRLGALVRRPGRGGDRPRRTSGARALRSRRSCRRSSRATTGCRAGPRAGRAGRRRSRYAENFLTCSTASCRPSARRAPSTSR